MGVGARHVTLQPKQIVTACYRYRSMLSEESHILLLLLLLLLNLPCRQRPTFVSTRIT
jgi:hypothetical protein